MESLSLYLDQHCPVSSTAEHRFSNPVMRVRFLHGALGVDGAPQTVQDGQAGLINRRHQWGCSTMAVHWFCNPAAVGSSPTFSTQNTIDRPVVLYKSPVERVKATLPGVAFSIRIQRYTQGRRRH